MKDIQKIKEFFSQPMKESLTGGYPHTKTSGKNFEKITITEPIDDATKNKMIKSFRAAGWDAKPNNGGGITAIKKSIMEDNLDEGKGYVIDSIKRRLDALGVKYEMSTTDKVRPFKVIYQPINKSDKWYDEFEDIVDLFNLKGVVKSSMSEAKFMSGMLSGKDFINTKLKNYPKAKAKVNQLIDMIGESKFTIEMAEWIFDFFNNAHFESPINEAKKEDKVDTITMDIPLFLRMLEYSREDASQDMDLHDVTEKAISLGKERGILQMDDYDEIVGAAEEIKEASSFAQQAAIAISKKKSGNYDKEGKRIKETSNPQSGKAAPYGSGYKPLEERIAKALDLINEELCPAGKAYRKRRMAAGEKSSAYLSGRAVKVCKGQMSGKKKK